MTDPTLLPDDILLAMTAIGEARGEGTLGMTDIVCTVMNRVKKPCWWGHNIHEVCLFPKQYSCWNDGDPNRLVILNYDQSTPLFQTALAIAREGTAGTLADRTNGATHYRRIGTPASWWQGQTPCFIDGRHEFFNNIA